MKRLKESLLTRKREGFGMTRRDVAIDLGCTVSAVQCWETGARRPSMKYIGRIQIVYGLTNSEMIAVMRGKI